MSTMKPSLAEPQTSRPRVLIEDWLPVDTIGAESMRERGASSALPPNYFLHVWWARRPLTTSRAAILASVLPDWSSSWPAPLAKRFPTEASYRAWFLELCGIYGDPVAGRKKIQWANDRGIKLKEKPYSHDRAFTVNPRPDDLATLAGLLEVGWGKRQLRVLDTFAGGGSIPFEALRYGFDTTANELNPVACVILRATLDYPARFGTELVKDVRRYGETLSKRVGARLEAFFPQAEDGESIHAYTWARTVACPYTGKPIPLSPNWWLSKDAKNPIAVEPIFDPDALAARFRIVQGKAACKAVTPDTGTVKGGNAISPWAQNQPVDGDYIKAEAQAGRMGQQLYALAVKVPRQGFIFRAPSGEDLAAIEAAETELDRLLPEWEAQDLVPREPFPAVSNDSRPLQYGMPTWGDFFAPRQLLSICTFLEELRLLQTEIKAELEPDRAAAVCTYLAFVLDKGIDRNCYLASWIPQRLVIRSVFDRHDFAFKATYAEFDASRNLFSWGLSQVTDSLGGLAQLQSGSFSMFSEAETRLPIRILQGSAQELSVVDDQSIDLVCLDPPYYEMVMYAECSDFFYVWMKRTLGDVYPEWFRTNLTNKDDEAVANVARFASAGGRKKKELAAQDYERKMAASFRECHRVLQDDGVLTVMFTHKQVDAWDTLATALLGAGFTIHSSWPVHTEFANSLHQAKKNAAASTILLTCRKRSGEGSQVWWDDLKGRVRQVAREKAEEYSAQGIGGADLYIATFGPTLAILSESWPVLSGETDPKTGEPLLLRPEVALDLARQEVIQLRKRGLLLDRPVQFDPMTDWYLLAWDAFQAAEFPADEGRKLALAFGLDLERDLIRDARLISKKSGTVVLQDPKLRVAEGRVDPEAAAFNRWIDAVQTAMVLYDEDGPRACEAWLRAKAYLNDPTFKALIQALLNAIPRTKSKGKFNRKEAATIDALRLAFFDDLQAPADPDPQVGSEQVELSFAPGDDEEE